ncbi:LLM class flavin-dependent oxidoreductase [Streptomyces griseus]|uniref:LLM class flavin-dependent oxidoreductase n=1 Tax=Streptomyces griseus TaxID=1911 RepID=UPI0036847D2D
MSIRTGRPVLLTPLLTAGGPAGAAAFTRARQRALACEQAEVDALLLHDQQSTAGHAHHLSDFEAGTLAAALAVATGHIGLISTICTAQLAPYHVARALATVDFLSAGRSGWAVAAPDDEAAQAEQANYRAPAHAPDQNVAPAALQQNRAAEFIDVVRGLWDSFQDDAFLRDRESGIYFVPERLHQLDHTGPHFDVSGPLNIARPPQGHPVLLRRVQDTEDLPLIGRSADIAVMPASGEHQEGAARTIRDAVRGHAREAGRKENDVLVVLEHRVHAGDTDTAAAHLQEFFATQAADGFVLLPPEGPDDAAHTAMVDLASALRRQSHLPAAPPGSTLRARLGLPRPVGLHPTD